jgi:D-sedoheptulose 7-phosphate isomerase
MDAFIDRHLSEVTEVVSRLNRTAIRSMVDRIVHIRARGGRVFFLGVGGSAGSCSHAVNDFRKLCGIESYSPIDNVSELTARINDEGWENCFADWLKISRLKKEDALFVLSVGGGNLEKNVSPNLVKAIDYAKSAGASILGIVGRDGGYTALQADVCVLIPVVNAESITPHTEAFHAVIWHLLVSHPDLKSAATKWESVAQK